MATLRIFYQPKIHLRLLNWAFLSAVLGMLPAIACADIIWSGDFETGNVRYKVRERYSFGATDWRGVFGSQGA